MAAWDDEEEEETPVAVVASASKAPKKSKFDDEDASDSDPKDSWDAESDEEEEVKKPAPTPAAALGSMRAKGAKNTKIAERDAADKAKQEALAAEKDDDPQARKLKEKNAILKSDMENAAALFGSTSLAEYTDPFTLKCSSKEDFEVLSTSISDLLISKYGNHPQYATFVTSLIKNVCAPLKDVDVRKNSAALAVIANTKQQEQKNAAGGKKKKVAKPLLGASKGIGRADTGNYDEILDDSGDYDDFM